MSLSKWRKYIPGSDWLDELVLIALTGACLYLAGGIVYLRSPWFIQRAIEAPSKRSPFQLQSFTVNDEGCTLGQVATQEIKAEYKALLDVISWAEGTCLYADPYAIIVGGTTFTDFSKHPERFNVEVTSDAAGKYQFLSTSYRDYSDTEDFSPESQDRAALNYLEELGALDALDSGNLEQAISLAGQSWASLPGSSLVGGAQVRTTMPDAIALYQKALEMYQSQKI